MAALPIASVGLDDGINQYALVVRKRYQPFPARDAPEVMTRSAFMIANILVKDNEYSEPSASPAVDLSGHERGCPA